MKLSKNADYAFRILIYLSAKPSASVREISENYGISYAILIKVVHQLEKAGHLKITKGKGGCISLKHPPEKICLADVYFDIESEQDLVECFNPATNTCRISSGCDLKHVLKEANQAFVDTLGNYSLKDVTLNVGALENLVGKREK